MSQIDEFYLIEKYFKSIGSKFLSKKNFILGSGDDSAVFKSTNNLCYSVDQNYEGIHFPKSLTILLKIFSFLPSKVYFGLVGRMTKYQKKN